MKKILIGLLIIASIGFAGCGDKVATTNHSVKDKTKVTSTEVSTLASNQVTEGQQVQTDNLQYYFTKANQHPDQQLIKVIDNSTSSLDIAIYSITKTSIVNAIIQAKNRGVVVHLMTDKLESKGKSESKELALLQADNIPVKINTHAGLLHIKMTVVDKKVATTGSYNYTENATTKNDEILVIINDSKVASDFDNEFQSMWNNTTEYENYN